MTIRNGIDCATQIDSAVATKLASLGQTFVARYLVPASMEWKRLSPQEAQAISDAGMDILSVFESQASRALSGLNGGAADAKAALLEIERVGQPIGSAVYFAVDFDVTTVAQMELIASYLQGARAVLSPRGYKTGVYAEYSVIEEMAQRGECDHFWQTYAWSAGKRSAHANVYQYKNGQSMAGITVDYNNSYGNEGFWNLRVEPKKLTTFSDVEAGRWSEADIAGVVARGEMVGYPDGTFKPGQTVTREELAVVLGRLAKK